MNMHEFFSMGGQGVFVWGAYGMTALLLAVEVVAVQRCSAATRIRLMRIRHDARNLQMEATRSN